MKSMVVVALFPASMCYADDVYLKTGFVFRNVQVVDTVGSRIDIQSNGQLLGIQVSDILKIDAREVDPLEKSTYGLYSQELATAYKAGLTQQDLANAEELIRKSVVSPNQKKTFVQKSVVISEHRNLPFLVVSAGSFLLAWDYYKNADNLILPIRIVEYLGGDAGSLKNARRRKNVIGSALVLTGIASTVFAILPVEVSLSPEQ